MEDYMLEGRKFEIRQEIEGFKLYLAEILAEDLGINETESLGIVQSKFDFDIDSIFEEFGDIILSRMIDKRRDKEKMIAENDEVEEEVEDVTEGAKEVDFFKEISEKESIDCKEDEQSCQSDFAIQNRIDGFTTTTDGKILAIGDVNLVVDQSKFIY